MWLSHCLQPVPRLRRYARTRLTWAESWRERSWRSTAAKIFARRRKAIVLPPLHTKPVDGFDENRLDILLDKVRVSGYASLSAAEKKELNELSNKIK